MNLFARIFVSFWLCTVAIIGSWMLAGEYFAPALDALDGLSPGNTRDTAQSGPTERGPTDRGPTDTIPGKALPSDRRPPPPLARPPRQLFQIYYGLQNVGANELETWIRQQETDGNVDIRLVDITGREIFGRELIPGSAEVLRRLEGFRRRTTVREGPRLLIGQEIYRPEWGSLRLVIAERPPPSPVIAFIKQHLWLRLVLAVLISAAISYLVSRYLTRPIKNLQQASRALAGGELDVRIDVPSRGGGETAGLARDFNAMAEQLQEKIQAQKRLLNDVSHELRSPLARLRVALALAEKDPANSTAHLQRIEQETGRLDELIGQLLSVPDTVEAFEDSIDLVGLLRAVCEDAGFEAAPDNKRISLHCPDRELLVRSHGDLLKKALENILRNAVHYSPPGGEVSVDLSTDEKSIRIAVSDQGPGVAEDELDKIFEPFYRTDQARQQDTGGHGLGLSIARRVVEQHGGSITAENARPGLRLHLVLPQSPV